MFWFYHLLNVGPWQNFAKKKNRHWPWIKTCDLIIFASNNNDTLEIRYWYRCVRPGNLEKKNQFIGDIAVKSPQPAPAQPTTVAFITKPNLAFCNYSPKSINVY